MKKLRNINFYSVCSKISKRFLVFVRHKDQPVFGIYFVARALQYLDTASNLAPCTCSKPDW
jgi:hypothetical protein